MSGAISVRPFRDGDEAAWDAFVEGHPEGTFLHLAGWRTVLERGLGHRTHYLVAEAPDGVVRGVLPLARVKSVLFGDALVSTPMCVYGGAVAADEATRERLEDAAAELARELGVGHLELRNRRRTRADWPANDALYVTFRKAILPTEEENLKAIPRKQRAMVRKGIAAGLVAEIDDDVERFFRIYSVSVRNHGTPVFPRRYFRTLKAVFGDACEVQTTVHDGAPVSTVMSFYFRDEVMPYYGGGLPAARRLKAFDFQYWELMRRACARGIRVFDYGRSKRGTGSFSFKKNWGFEPEPLVYQYRLERARSLPEVNPLNPRYRLLIRTWQRLPLPLANTLGPLVSPYLA